MIVTALSKAASALVLTLVMAQAHAAPAGARAAGPARDPKEALARTMVGDYPGVREELATLMGSIEARMNTYLQETVFPVMVPELMKVIGK